MSEVSKNTQPITVEEFFERAKKKVHQTKNYYSLYITPTGQVIDCGYPEGLGHNEISIEIYKNLDILPEDIFNSCLRGLNIPFKEIPYYLEDYHKLLDIQYEDIRLFWEIDKVLLGTEDRICQDMGFVKVSINNNLKTSTVVVPNPIFEKHVTAHQKEIIEKLSEYFNINFDDNLKSEQKENTKLAATIQHTLNKINGKTV